MAPSPKAISFHDSLAPLWEKGYESDTFSVRTRVLSSLIPKREHGAALAGLWLWYRDPVSLARS